MKKRNNLKVSVITICYNAVFEIERTLLSVIGQENGVYEYIVVDGGSGDGTVDIIKKYEKNISKWISEPDRGCYDAMNKGIDMATGDWIVFMNSGDTFYSSNSIQQAFSTETEADVIYGDVKVIASFGSYETKPYPLNYLEIGIMPFCHQASFIKTELIRKHKFNIEYKISADYNLFLSIWKESKSFFYIPITIAIYDISQCSLSFDHHEQVLKENFHILGKNDFLSHLKFIYSIMKCRIRETGFQLFSRTDLKSQYFKKALVKSNLIKTKTW